MPNICTVCMKISTENKVSYFSYPRDKEKRHQWLQIVGRQDLIGKIDEGNARVYSYRICERHFVKEFITKKGIVKHLTENAYPTLNLPSYGNGACTSSTSKCEVITVINNQNNYENIDTGKNITILPDGTTCGVQVIISDASKTSGYDGRSSQTALHLSANTQRTTYRLHHYTLKGISGQSTYQDESDEPKFDEETPTRQTPPRLLNPGLNNTGALTLVRTARPVRPRRPTARSSLPTPPLVQQRLLNSQHQQAAVASVVSGRGVGVWPPRPGSPRVLNPHAAHARHRPPRPRTPLLTQSALVEEIVIKEEITDEEKIQCRLCLSVGRRMQELGEYAPLYRKLLFENNYQHTTIPSFMFSMLACWECIAELRRVKRFQEKVRRANNAFETNQNQKCENLSNLSTILIGDYKNSNAGEDQPASIEDCAQEIKEEAVEPEVEETSLPDPLAVEPDVKTTRQNQKCENLSNLSTILIGDYKNSNAGEDQPASIEDCAQDIKEEAVEPEVEETSLPDPLAVEPDVKTTRQDTENFEIQHEPNTSITPKKVVKRPIPQPEPNQKQPKRTKLEQNVKNPEPMRTELDQSGSKTTQEDETYPKSIAETDCDAIFGKVKVEIDELEKILMERRNKESFKSMKFKCDSCVLGFSDHNRLLDHNRNFHDKEVGSCECHICERRFDDDSLLSAHYRNHFVKFVCKLCNFECYTKTGRTIHFKRHKGALQGTSLEALLRKKLAGGSSRQSST